MLHQKVYGIISIQTESESRMFTQTLPKIIKCETPKFQNQYNYRYDSAQLLSQREDPKSGSILKQPYSISSEISSPQQLRKPLRSKTNEIQQSKSSVYFMTDKSEAMQLQSVIQDLGGNEDILLVAGSKSIHNVVV